VPKLPKVVDNKEFSRNLEKRTRQFAVRIIGTDILPMEKIKWEYEECSELLALFTSIGKGTEL
jgi:hypothetical protein